MKGDERQSTAKVGATGPSTKVAPGVEWMGHPLDLLLDLAWATRRRNFADRIDFAAPGAKRYDTAHFRNHPRSFVDVSVTGTACALKCEHCQGRLLETMLPATTPDELLRLGRSLAAKGTKGVLISGGAGLDGEVPLGRFAEVLGELKRSGLTVIVHTGLVDRAVAIALKEAGVDQVLLDVIGDAETCREIYHLDRGPEDYRRALEVLKEAGLSLAPHIVIGLHRGEIRGEYVALDQIAAVGVDRLVLVALNPLVPNPLPEAKVSGLVQLAAPGAAEAARVMAAARLQLPYTPISLGCARPAGPLKIELEHFAIDAGANAIAYPADETVDYAKGRGLDIGFHELCCSLGTSP